MDYIRDRESNIPFSLHDSRIIDIIIDENKLSLKINPIFQYIDNEEKCHNGIIEFTNIDKDACDIMIFNTPRIIYLNLILLIFIPISFSMWDNLIKDRGRSITPWNDVFVIKAYASTLCLYMYELDSIIHNCCISNEVISA